MTQRPDANKKPYSAPILSTLGNVRVVTQTAGTKSNTRDTPSGGGTNKTA